MKTRRLHGLFCLFAMLAVLLPFPSLADDGGVLTEVELGGWVASVLRLTLAEQPRNAPVGEESLTEDGYAFLYSFATLYYDKPVLDEKSVLRGFSVTDEAFDTPRGIRLGAPADLLVSAYGWQNPMLLGDGSFAAFYLLNQLPEGAYWAWAQCREGRLAAVQCTVHVRGGGGGYTDAGIQYQAEDGLISAIRVYGLNEIITVADVANNLSEVRAVQAAITGDEVEEEDRPVQAQGVTEKSGAAEFGVSDLRFAGIDFLTLAEAEADAAFGRPAGEEWVRDNTGEWMHTTRREGIVLTHGLDADRQNSRLEILSFTGAGMEGPRGVRIGDTLDSVLARFRSDGTGLTQRGEALLYGGLDAPPYGALTVTGNEAALRYVALAESAGDTREVGLYLTFHQNLLIEIMLYSF